MKPITLYEANRLCAKYRYLRHRQEDGLLIEDIAAAPSDELNQWFFLQFYIEYQDARRALEFYLHNTFEVVLIVRVPETAGAAGYSCLPLSAYLEGCSEGHPSDAMIKALQTV